MSANEPTSVVYDEDKQRLLEVARTSVHHGLRHYRALPVNVEDFPLPLREVRASFVTIELNDRLRGCIGTLEAKRPLVVDVAENAYAAAFRDPRFPPVSEFEVDQLDFHLSLLTTPEPIKFVSQEDLIAKLVPGVDGLILIEGHRRGTFLPAVWEQIKEPHVFLAHLKTKAGLPEDYWSDTIQVQRYAAESIP